MLAACGAEDSSTFLEGAWADSCEDYNEEGTVYGYPIYEFQGNKLTVVANTYSDSACETLRYSAVIKGSFTLGEDIILPESGLTATQLLITISEYTATPYSNDSATSKNESAHCGFSDWAVNQSKDLLGCFLSNNGGNPSKEIVRVDGNMLQFGDFDFIGEDGFPTRLNTPLQKQ
jgi:hypothetical protein